jgi:hypothetical protein
MAFTPLINPVMRANAPRYESNHSLPAAQWRDKLRNN